MTNPLTPELAEDCRALRRSGLNYLEIATRLRLPYGVYLRLCENPEPEWPKLVTRIDQDGARFVRCP